MSRTYRRKRETETTTRYRYYRTPHTRQHTARWEYIHSDRQSYIQAGDSVVCWAMTGKHPPTLDGLVHFYRYRFHMDNRSICDPWMKCYYRRLVRKHYQHETYLLMHTDREFLTRSIYEHDGWWFW